MAWHQRQDAPLRRGPRLAAPPRTAAGHRAYGERDLLAAALAPELQARHRVTPAALAFRLRTALSAEQAHFADHQAYTPRSGPTWPRSWSPALTFDAAPDQTPTTGSIAYAAGGASVALATRSATGSCFYLRDTAFGGTTYLRNSVCDRPSAPTGAFTATGWQ